ncbi:MAG TPA: hypothetical protein VJ650_00595 [Gemmatimonadaceae bacterium]|nr:hypothetical protein [Gemmatimonadaceae bacterium]
MNAAPPKVYQRPLPSRAVFLAHVARNFAIGSGIVALSLGVGLIGYHGLAGLPWLDALLNAAMILTGMGPVDAITTTRGKVFATFYALFSGIAFLSVMAVLIAPIVHRFLHRFHLDLASGKASGAAPTLAERERAHETCSCAVSPRLP